MCELIVDCPHSTPKWTDEGMIVLRNQNIRNGQLDLSSPSFTDTAGYQSRIKRAVPQAGDIVFTREAPMGEVCLIPEGLTCCLGQRQVLLRPKKSVNGRYLYWALQSPFVQHQISWNEGTGTTVSNVRIPTLKSLEIPRREPHEAKIADTLGSLADKIQMNHRINQTLEQIAQAIFKSWFVDFEPVKAKHAALEAGGSEEDALLAAMQAISGKVEMELLRLQAEQPEHYAELRNTAELFPSAMQDSELEEIPEGWNVSQIGDEVTVVGGGTPSTKNRDFWEGGKIHWTTPKDLSGLNDKVLIDTERKITSAGLTKISSGLLPVDTVLMSSRAPVGYLALAKTPVAVNQGYIAMKCDKSLSPEFVLQWCVSRMNEIEGRASGTTFAEISKKSFKVIPVAVPQEDLINSYTKIAKSIYKNIEISARESGSLANLRDTLLPQLLTDSCLIDIMEA
ncbi:restriction endonuclease subunit S [Marinobacter halophilus]|uniref:Restriction endonuclease subunit S n=2 Tax=Marinobacter halophilus TaxID=1323740 RepID=A0A2T1KFQ2_9GAMM|nr:restriction endonuclease subunit S [Marinobacter halophilus]